MRIFKFMVGMVLVLLLVVVALVGVLENERALNFLAKEGIARSGVDISYKHLRGDLFSGLEMEGVVYEGKAGGDIALKADLLALKEGVLHIELLKATNLWIEKEFLRSLIESNTTKKKEKAQEKESFLKAVQIDHLEISLVDIAYQIYHLQSATLKGKELWYDLNQTIDGSVWLEAKSNVADLKADMLLKKSHYQGDFSLFPKNSFLNRYYLQENNITLFKAPKLTLKAQGNLEEIKHFLLDSKEANLRYGAYMLQIPNLHTEGSYHLQTEDLKAKSTLEALSNVADLNLSLETLLNLRDLNNTLHYRLHSNISAFKPGFGEILKEENLTFAKSSSLLLDTSGDLKSVDASLRLLGGEIFYDIYKISPKTLLLKSHYDLRTKALWTKGKGRIESNVADMQLDFNTSLALEDLAHTLKLNLVSDIDPHRVFVKKVLEEQNITLRSLSSLHVKVTTKESALKSDIGMGSFVLQKDGVDLDLRKIVLQSNYNLQTTKLSNDLNATLLSNLANVTLRAKSGMVLEDLNHTLSYRATMDVVAKEGYLKKELQQKIFLKKLSPLVLDLTGDIREVDANLSLKGRAKVGRFTIEPTIEKTTLHYDLKEHTLKSKINMLLKSSIADAMIQADVALDSDDINRSTTFWTKMKLRQKRAFEAIDLRDLGEIVLDANGTLASFVTKANAKKLRLDLKAKEMDRFDFFLDTKRLYLDRLYKEVPPLLKKSDASLFAKGYYTLSKKSAFIEGKIKRFHYAKRTLWSTPFTFRLDKENFALSPFSIKGKDLSLILDAAYQDGRLKAHIANKALNAKVRFGQKPLFSDTKIRIDSIEALLKEVDKLYPLGKIPKITGSLRVDARMEGERIKTTLTSPKIAFKAGRLENILLKAYYYPNTIDIDRFDLLMRGFRPKEMNKKITLAHPAKIVLDQNNTSVNFELKNLLKIKAEQKGDLLHAKLTTKKLFLAAPEYGHTKLTTNIDLYKSGKQTAISGEVLLKETEITYESRVLDVSQDPDIVVIDKSKKKKVLGDNSFVENFFLDLRIRSVDEVLYKVEAGEIVLKPLLEIRKDFGSSLKLLGKIKILEGEYDFGDKRFQLKEGAIAFRGLKEINPLLDLHVVYPIDEVTIFIDILGDKRKPKLVFKSDPMMSKKDIFSYLLFGFAVSESDGAQSSAANAAEKIFGRALAKDLARELKLDRLDLTRNQLGGINIKAGKKVGKKTIIYYQNKDLESSVIIERKLGKHLELDTEIGQSSQAVDLYFKRGYK